MDNSNLINNTINPVESLARNIVASIKAGNTSNHTKSDTSESWNITNVYYRRQSGGFPVNRYYFAIYCGGYDFYAGLFCYGRAFDDCFFYQCDGAEQTGG